MNCKVFSNFLIFINFYLEGSLCGVHCLNNLLQGSYYTAIDLMEIAQDIDKKEKALVTDLETNFKKINFFEVC